MATTVPAAEATPKAGFWVRFVAYLIDAVILIVVAILVNLILRDQLAALVNFVIGIAYFVYFWSEAGRGRTPGMRVMNLRVVRTDGAPLTYGAAVVRYVGFIIAAIPILIGLIWVAFDANKQGWHDKIAGTYVIRA